MSSNFSEGLGPPKIVMLVRKREREKRERERERGIDRDITKFIIN